MTTHHGHVLDVSPTLAWHVQREVGQERRTAQGSLL